LRCLGDLTIGCVEHGKIYQYCLTLSTFVKAKQGGQSDDGPRKRTPASQRMPFRTLVHWVKSEETDAEDERGERAWRSRKVNPELPCARGGLPERSGVAPKDPAIGGRCLCQVYGRQAAKGAVRLKKRLKEISGQIRARSNELQQELSPENYKRVEDLIRLIESYDAVVVQLLKLPMGLGVGRSARSG
jgi:hypothetical protein